MSASLYAPQPVAREERAIEQMRRSAESLQRMLEAQALTPEQFELEVRLQIMWLTCAVNDYQQAQRERVLVAARMRKAGWLV